MAVTINDSGITFNDGSVQPTALTTGTQTIAGAKTFSSNVTLGAGVQGALVLATAQSASGTNIDFNSIPSWVRRITVMLNGVSTNGTNNPMVQLGTSGGIDAAGYVSSANSVGFTTGFGVGYGTAAASTLSGVFILTHMGGNLWVYGGSASYSASAGAAGGTKTLSGTLDRLRLTTVGGTDTFDAGSVNIMYEG